MEAAARAMAVGTAALLLRGRPRKSEADGGRGYEREGGWPGFAVVAV